MEAVYERAYEASRNLNNDAELFIAIRGLGYVYHVRANLRGATQLIDEAVDVTDEELVLRFANLRGCPR